MHALNIKKIKFWKMHGLGNDFVILDFRKNVTDLRKDQISLIANRKFGLGCDQLIIIKKGNKFFDVEILMYNSDGSETDTCGNGTRCVASILFNEKNNEIYKIKTKAYVVSAWKDKSNKNFISVDLGTIKTQWHEIPLEKEVNTLFLDLNEKDLNLASCLSLGNPHTVFFVKDLHNIDIKKIGKNIENHSLFPDKTNVEFVQILNKKEIIMKVWERGVGITKACGSGACAAVAASIRRGITEDTVEVHLDGGKLKISWINYIKNKNDFSGGKIIMTGPSTFVAKGKIDNSFIYI